ncbi:MAG: hypothetical protein PHT88_04690 [Candidatus Moranbacteria bacterium]|nr:hypothetical protein [Candidatus Moranbacteria bacterium]
MDLHERRYRLVQTMALLHPLNPDRVQQQQEHDEIERTIWRVDDWIIDERQKP